MSVAEPAPTIPRLQSELWPFATCMLQATQLPEMRLAVLASDFPELVSPSTDTRSPDEEPARGGGGLGNKILNTLCFLFLASRM
mmetsp:Transcript_49195/g.110282  ORF Transcript_49195/g.110282 Transcript_49195/m.110282 type:complete len:84 (+) Transcript_49195:78-329(+)